MTLPTDQDWEIMVFCQEVAHAVRKSNDLRLPRDPELALKILQGRVAEIRYERERGKS